MLSNVRKCSAQDDDACFDVLDINRMTMEFGKALYWNMYDEKEFQKSTSLTVDNKSFGLQCLNFYIDTIEAHQKVIYTFLWCWKHVFLGKDVGLIIAKMLWDQRYKHFDKSFEF